MDVLILRGISGSGKTTYAKSISVDPLRTTILSADNYFMVGGQYLFDPTKLGQAHSQCLRKFLTALSDGRTGQIVIDNCNTTAVEIAPYYAAAEAYNRSVEIVQVLCDVDIALNRNTHGVPEHSVRLQYRRLGDPLPTRWKLRYVKGM